MTNYLDIKQAAERSGYKAGYLRWLCIKGKLPGAIKKGGRWYIPPTAHPKLAKQRVVSNLVNAEELHDLPIGKREQALRRVGIIKEFLLFETAFDSRTTALIHYCRRNGIAKRTLERWLSRYRNQGLLGVVDKRTGSTSVRHIIGADALELFKSMYLTQQRLSVKTCWQNVNFVNTSQNKGWKVPSLRRMYQIVRQIPLPVQVLHREGLAAYEAKCAPYIQRDPDSVEPGQVWVGDHSQFNCWIRHRGRWIRPWLTAWQDMRSRAIIGWHISASPNQTTILLAAKRGIESYGPPDSVKIDNGKDYDSQVWTGTTKARRRLLKAGYIDEQMVAGIYAMMDIKVSFAIPYHPQAKPIERFFDTLDCQFTKTMPTYCGKDTDRKPDYLNNLLQGEAAGPDAYDITGFAGLFGRYVEAYNSAPHSGAGMGGRSPAEVLATRQSRRCLVEGVLELLMRVWSGELVVGKNGVRFKGMWYGQFNTELIAHQGRKVRLSYDPDDLRQVYVYDAVTLRLMTIAEQNQLIRWGDPVSEENLRHAMHQKSRAVKAIRQACDSRLTANMDLPDLTIRAMQEANEPPAEPQPARLRPVRTPLDGQVPEHKRLRTVKAVKKAAGAEAISTVLDMDLSALSNKRESERIDLDLSQLKPKQETVDLELFKNGTRGHAQSP